MFSDIYSNEIAFMSKCWIAAIFMLNYSEKMESRIDRTVYIPLINPEVNIGIENHKRADLFK